MLASVSAMISTAAQGNGNVKIGLNLLMPSFSSIYIGWSIFRRPCVLGTFLGALLTTVMTSGFIVVNVPYYYADLIIAFVLIFAILLSKVDLSATMKKFTRRGKETV
jgi:ribose transport system permease protein